MKGSNAMPEFLIEREIPGAGDLSAEQLHAISQKSCSVLQNLGAQIHSRARGAGRLSGEPHLRDQVDD